MIAGLAGATYYAHKSHVELNPATNCPISGPKSVHIILIDQSDPISPQQAQRVRQWTQLARDDAAVATRFDIYTFEGDIQNVLQPVLSVCSSERKANPLYQNPEMVRTQYETKFQAVLEETVDNLLKATNRSNSPVVESLRAAAQTSFGLITDKSVHLEVTLISDLIQHTASLSHYRSAPDFEQLSHRAEWPRLRPDLRGAEVEILYILRPTAVRNNAAIQNRGHQDFWANLIAASGGRVTEFMPF